MEPDLPPGTVTRETQELALGAGRDEPQGQSPRKERQSESGREVWLPKGGKRQQTPQRFCLTRAQTGDTDLDPVAETGLSRAQSGCHGCRSQSWQDALARFQHATDCN